MEIGKEIETIVVEPIEPPVPVENPAPDLPKEPVPA